MIAHPSIRRLAAALGIAAMLTAVAAPAAQACTGIRLIAADGTVVYGRTMEFATELNSEALMVPRGFARTGITPDGQPGLTWTTKYATVGLNGAGLPVLFDGLNEKGLAGGMFYFPGSAGYMPYTPADAGRTISQWQVLSWALENFASVAEVKANIGTIVVPSVLFPAWGFAPEAHYVLHDTTGQSIVIEYVGGRLNVHDNPLGVVTNAPAFDWHMTNLRNYIGFSMNNPPPVKLGTVTLEPTGQGAGMLGLPGDFTPPSRFVRAVAFSQSVFKAPTAPDAVLQLFHVLNQFDIPKGSARDGRQEPGGAIAVDYTLWTTASDLNARRFHFRTYENSQIRSIDLMSMAIDGKEMVKLPITSPEVIVPLVR